MEGRAESTDKPTRPRLEEEKNPQRLTIKTPKEIITSINKTLAEEEDFSQILSKCKMKEMENPESQ